MNKWPGASPFISYGQNMSINYNNKDINSRQNDSSLKFHSCGLAKIFPNIQSTPTYSAPIADTLQFLESEFVPLELASQFNSESASLVADDAFDPTVGQKVVYKDDQLIWANDSILKFLENDTVVDELDIESPILQVEPMTPPGTVLLRTRKGLNLLQDANQSSIYTGDTMNTVVNEYNAALSLPDNSIMIMDLQAGKLKYGEKLPRADISGYNRVSWASENSLFFSDRNDIRLIDIRQQRSTILRESNKTHLTVMRDMISDGNDIFVLESSSVLWYDARMPRDPALTAQHFLARNEPSWRLSLLEKRCLLLNSVTCAYNIVMTFGTDENFPVSKVDPYILDLWPTIPIQSQVACKTSKGYDLYISSTGGGLFKQELSHQNPSTPPQLDPDERPVEYPVPQPDFTYDNVIQNSHTYDLSRGFKNLFSPPSIDPEGHQSDRVNSILPALGYDTIEALSASNRKVWLDCVSQEVADKRRAHVDGIVRDLGNMEYNDQVDTTIPKGIHESVLEILEDWPDPEDNLPKGEPPTSPLPSSNLPTSSFTTYTQPQEHVSMTQGLFQRPSNSQPLYDDGISFSQPLPSRSQGARKKKKKKRTRDGFT